MRIFFSSPIDHLKPQLFAVTSRLLHRKKGDLFYQFPHPSVKSFFHSLEKNLLHKLFSIFFSVIETEFLTDGDKITLLKISFSKRECNNTVTSEVVSIYFILVSSPSATQLSIWPLHGEQRMQNIEPEGQRVLIKFSF